MVTTVVIAPAAVLAFCDIRLRSTAPHVVQSDLSASGTVAVTDKASSVSVSKHVANNSCRRIVEIIIAHRTPGAVVVQLETPLSRI